MKCVNIHTLVNEQNSKHLEIRRTIHDVQEEELNVL